MTCLSARLPDGQHAPVPPCPASCGRGTNTGTRDRYCGLGIQTLSSKLCAAWLQVDQLLMDPGDSTRLAVIMQV